MIQRITTYRDLKKFLTDSLTEEQLNQDIQIWLEDLPIIFPRVIEITKEDAYASIEYPEEGTFLLSDLSPQDIEEQKDRIEIVSPKGTVVMYE